MRTYITVQGDTFDWIAKRVYGNEKRMDALIQANPRYVGTVAFSAGTTLNLPELTAETLHFNGPPPWRKS